MKKTSLSVLLLLLVLPLGVQAEDTSEPVVAAAGKAKFGGLIQAWTVNDTTALSTAAKWNFRLRRAELKFDGSVTEKTRWFLMLDAAKQDLSSTRVKILQDLGVVFSPAEGVELVMGQFKMTTTAEGLDSSGQLMTPERSYVARTFGDTRQPGFMVDVKKEMLRVRAMIFNGAGAGESDATNAKDLAIRLDATPIEGISVGAFTHAADMSYNKAGRWGLNAKASISELTVRGEAVVAGTAGTKGNGFFVDIAYKVTESFEPVLRWDQFTTLGSTATAPSLAANYYFLKHNSRIQASYALLDGFKGSNGSYDLSKGTKGTVFVLAFLTAL